MSLLVVGTIAYDSIETPHGKVSDEIGGSATFFALAASRFTDMRVCGVVGADFPVAKLKKLFDGRNVDFSGVESVKSGKTFRWAGRYEGDMNSAQTLDTQLNVLAKFKPKLPGDYPKTPFVFLANTAPGVQLDVLKQVQAEGRRPFVVCDTMNFWIETQKDALLDVLRRVDGLILNDGEARQLTGERNLIRAGTKVLDLGPKVVIVKKGEHGAFLFSTYLFHALPAYPVSEVVDPTGAGDSFAGGVMGHIARTGRVSIGNLKRGLVYGTVAASFTVGDFGTRALAAATREDFETRVQEFLHFVVNGESKPTVRVFAAVEVPEDVRERIAAAARELLSGVRAAKAVAAENLHVTVRFVGEVADAAIDPLCSAVREAAASVECSTAEVRGLGAFPNAKRPRVVWAGIADASDVFRRLESSVSARLATLGYPRENRPYSAHLTVARMREGVRDLGDLTARLAASERVPPAFGAIPVRAVTVFRSDLGRSGSRYTALARFALAKN